MKSLLLFICLFTLLSNSLYATQKLFSTPASSIGTYLPLASASGWVTAGTLDFTLENQAQVLISANLDAKLDTCTGGCPTPNKGGSMMVDLRVVNEKGITVLSRRMNGGMAILGGGASGVPINHMMIIPVSLNFPSNSLPPGKYKATLTVQNGTAYLMSYGFRQMVAQVFEE